MVRAGTDIFLFIVGICILLIFHTNEFTTSMRSENLQYYPLSRNEATEKSKVGRSLHYFQEMEQARVLVPSIHKAKLKLSNSRNLSYSL